MNSTVKKTTPEGGKSFGIKNTNAAKGLAICLMLLYHLFGAVESASNPECTYLLLNKESVHFIAGFGNICVSVFVFLTSFGISKGIFADENMTLKQAYNKAAKRFWKLMVSFFIFYVSVQAVWFWCFDYSSLYGHGWEGLMKMLIDSVGLANLFGTPVLNMTWWYMTLAYALIFAVPALAFLVRKTGPAILIASFFVPFIFLPGGNPVYGDFGRYFTVCMTAIVVSYTGFCDKFMEWELNGALKWLLGILLMVIAVILRQNPYVQDRLLWALDAPLSLVTVLFGGALLGSVPVVSNVFSFIGKHSMHIFFVHTFFYLILWRNFIFGFRYAALIFVMLLLVSLAYAVVLYYVKEGVRKLAGLIGKRIRKQS